MHPATKAHVYGMLGMIRHALTSIESAMANDKNFYANAATGHFAEDKPQDSAQIAALTEKEEAALAEMLGFQPDKA